MILAIKAPTRLSPIKKESPVIAKTLDRNYRSAWQATGPIYTTLHSPEKGIENATPKTLPLHSVLLIDIHERAATTISIAY